jgi:hypothetical protein
MPPEQDDSRERQLAALRRYVSNLDVRRQHDGVQVPDRPLEERRRPAWPWLLLTLLLMGVSLAGGIAIGANRDAGNRRTSGFAGVTASSVAASPTAAPECAEAVERANRSIGHAVKISAALREHTEIMNDLLNGKIDGATALRTGTPSLIVGSAESARFDLALADYKQVVDRCQLRVP